MSAETADQVLDLGADYLAEHGWCQRTFGYEENGPRCAAGSIRDIDVPTGEFARALRALTDYVGGDVPGWNDRSGQTAENVIHTMRSVARLLRSAS